MKSRKIVLLSAIAVLAVMLVVQLLTPPRGSVREMKLSETPDTIVICTAHCITVKAMKAGKELRTLIVGKDAPTASQTYISFQGGRDIYLEISVTIYASGSGDDIQYLCISSATPYKFVMGSYDAKIFLKPLADLQK